MSQCLCLGGAPSRQQPQQASCAAWAKKLWLLCRKMVMSSIISAEQPQQAFHAAWKQSCDCCVVKWSWALSYRQQPRQVFHAAWKQSCDCCVVKWSWALSYRQSSLSRRSMLHENRVVIVMSWNGHELYHIGRAASAGVSRCMKTELWFLRHEMVMSSISAGDFCCMNKTVILTPQNNNELHIDLSLGRRLVLHEKVLAVFIKQPWAYPGSRTRKYLPFLWSSHELILAAARESNCSFYKAVMSLSWQQNEKVLAISMKQSRAYPGSRTRKYLQFL